MARNFTDNLANYFENTTVPVTVAPFTMMCWLNTNAISGSHAAFSLADSASGNNYFFIGTTDNNSVARAGIRSPSLNINIEGGTITANTDHHICLVEASSSDHNLFVDGTSVATSTSTSAPSSLDRMRLGQIADSSPLFPLQGELSHCALWDTDLNDDEVASLGAGVSPLLVRLGNLRLYTPLWGNDDPEPEIIEGRNFTLTGTSAKSDSAALIMSAAPIFMGVPAAVAPAGRIMSSLVAAGGLVGAGGIAGGGGGLAA